jgi:hypothetical protein
VCLGLGHGVQGVGKCLRSKVLDVVQGRLLERPQPLIHSAAGNTVARGQQELAKGRSHVDVIELDHTVLDQGAQVLNVLARRDLLVDCNVDLCGRPPRRPGGRAPTTMLASRRTRCETTGASTLNKPPPNTPPAPPQSRGAALHQRSRATGTRMGSEMGHAMGKERPAHDLSGAGGCGSIVRG